MFDERCFKNCFIHAFKVYGVQYNIKSHQLSMYKYKTETFF